MQKRWLHGGKDENEAALSRPCRQACPTVTTPAVSLLNALFCHLQSFFSFLGFDTVSTAAEEARNPATAVPIGIVGSLVICSLLYAAMCVTIVGMVSTDAIDINAPFAVAYADIGMRWAGKIVAIGAIAGIVTSLLVNLFGQARLLYCLGREVRVRVCA